MPRKLRVQQCTTTGRMLVSKALSLRQTNQSQNRRNEVFGIITDILSIPQRTIEWLDDELLGSAITGPRRREEARKYAQSLVDQGHTVETATRLAIEKYG